MPVTIPTVHLNGTSKKELLDQLSEAHLAIGVAQDKLAKAMPHDRDYYVQAEPGTGARAREEMRDRIARLEAIKLELAEIANGVWGEIA